MLKCSYCSHQHMGKSFYWSSVIKFQIEFFIVSKKKLFGSLNLRWVLHKQSHFDTFKFHFLIKNELVLYVIGSYKSICNLLSIL